MIDDVVRWAGFFFKKGVLKRVETKNKSAMEVVIVTVNSLKKSEIPRKLQETALKTRAWVRV